MDKDVELVKKFWAKYYRSPRKEELVACGASKRIASYKAKESYRYFLTRNGFPIPNKSETYVMYDTHNKVRWIGTSGDLAEELGITRQEIFRAVSEKKVVQTEYRVMKYPFDGSLEGDLYEIIERNLSAGGTGSSGSRSSN